MRMTKILFLITLLLLVFSFGFYLLERTRPAMPDTLQEARALRKEITETLSRYSEEEYVTTGYTNHHKCVRKKWLDGKTSDGSTAERGTIAADISVLPYGTIIHIPGYGIGCVKDTGSRIRGKRLDLFFDTIGEAKDWGVQRQVVFIIRPRERRKR